MSNRHMILNLFFYNPQGDYRFSWRHPDAPEADIFTLDYYASLARKAEAATLDAIFVADHIAVWDTVPSGLSHYANARLEPLTLLSALAAVTEHIGLMATASTSYNEPYNLARYFASLDFLSNGRASWNVVTSWLEEEAANFGLEQLPRHGTRYQRANEFIDVVTRLWDSWEDGAAIFDKARGVFADADKVHHLDYQGEYFRVRGPLNVPRPPQGHPLLVQAGSSEAGKALAAAWSDMHFVFIHSVAEGLAYREEMNQRLRQHGRDPAHFKIIAGVLPVVVNAGEEKAARQQLNEQLMSDQMAIDLLSSYLRMDLSALPRDQPLPPLPNEESFDGIRTALKLIRQYDPLSADTPPLDFRQVRGMLKGFIDLVFRHEGRYYLLDYKSNWLGEDREAYTRPAMEQAMRAHRYDLQYQLYSLALHRYLRHRLADYDYERHFGGVIYLFLRGMDGQEGGQGIFTTRPVRPLIDGLDQLFAGETQEEAS
ncbi:LLM class flavin-dependent oxidoreductase [Klebsiella quasipneumoniae]|nr:LLM class flavin-dependent oxidoreductase [Klebsiella quasipneumoniae]